MAGNLQGIYDDDSPKREFQLRSIVRFALLCFACNMRCRLDFLQISFDGVIVAVDVVSMFILVLVS
jgi:hypothetical protein